MSPKNQCGIFTTVNTISPKAPAVSSVFRDYRFVNTPQGRYLQLGFQRILPELGFQPSKQIADHHQHVLDALNTLIDAFKAHGFYPNQDGAPAIKGQGQGELFVLGHFGSNTQTAAKTSQPAVFEAGATLELHALHAQIPLATGLNSSAIKAFIKLLHEYGLTKRESAYPYPVQMRASQCDAALTTTAVQFK